MATSMRSLILLCLMAASFVAVAEASKPAPVAGVDLKVKLKVNLGKCPSTVKLYVGAGGKANTCKGGAVTVVGPVKVHLDVPYLLDVKLEILLSASVKLEVKLKLELLELGDLVDGVINVVLDVVLDKKHKKVNVLCLGKVLKSLNLAKLLDEILGVGV